MVVTINVITFASLSLCSARLHPFALHPHLKLPSHPPVSLRATVSTLGVAPLLKMPLMKGDESILQDPVQAPPQLPLVISAASDILAQPLTLGTFLLGPWSFLCISYNPFQT